MISEKEREALMRLTMCAREECAMCKYEKDCNFDFQCKLATKNMNILADALRTDCAVKDKPQNCDTCKLKGFEGCEQPCFGCGRCDLYEPKDEPLKTTEYCIYCNHKGCKECISNGLDEHCVPSKFEEAVKDKPQLKEDGELEILTQTIEFPDTHQRFMFTRSIRADGDYLIIGDWEYKGKEDEPQTERSE